MNLSDILKSAQGGNGLQSLGKQFGLSPQQTQSAVEALLPAFSKGLQQTASTPQGLGSLLTMLGGGQGLQGQDAGNGILGQLFGSKDLSRAVAGQASQASGVGSDVLKKMLPALAGMLINGMAKQTNQQIASGRVNASNPLGEIIEQMMRQQGGGQAQRAPQPSQQSDNPLGDILGQILGGGQSQQAPQGGNNPLGDILGQILGGGQAQPRGAPQGQPGNNPLGDILEQMMRGRQGGGAQADYDEPEQPAPQRRAQPRQAPAQNPLEDIFGKMFNPGGQAQGPAQDQSYQQGVDNIFEQFRRGVDRRS